MVHNKPEEESKGGEILNELRDGSEVIDLND